MSRWSPALSSPCLRRRAVIEARSPLPVFSNILLRLEAVAAEEEVPELYAKVIRPP